MKRLLKLLIVLFGFYVFFQFLSNTFSKGYTVEYKVDDFDIKEIKTQRVKNETDNYYLEIITPNQSTFSFQTYKKLATSPKVVKEIKYYKDDTYECILPIYKNDKLYSDIICLKENTYYYYHTIQQENYKLDNFAKSIDNYNVEQFIDEEEVIKEKYSTTVYNNLQEKTYIGLEYYEGLYIISDKDIIYQKKIFNEETYQKEISFFTKDYYITADYNETFEFHKFIVVKLKDKTQFEIVSNNAISMYSYVQGAINNNIYIVDTANKKQYEVNIKNKMVIEIGNEKIGGKKYENGEWKTVNIYEVINNKMTIGTNDYSNLFEGYEKVDKVGNELSGYYYLYKKNNNKFDVYRVNVQNLNNKLYLFSTNNINHIVYDKDYIYYKDEDYIKFYHDLYGERKLLKNNEIRFNESIKFTITR